MKITKSRIFEVYEAQLGRRKILLTKNLNPKKDVYGERLFTKNNVEYREWDVQKSKLAAAILKGCPNVFIRKNDTVLYLGASTGTTVSHVSDIVGKDGFVFALDFAPRVVRELVFLCQERMNIAPILADANNLESFQDRVSKVSAIYQDIAQKNQVDIFLKNINQFLKNDGYGLLAVKARCIDVSKKPKTVFEEVRAKLEKEVSMIDSRILDPFQKDHCFFIVKKK